jgi:hypothetical protein
MRLSEEERVWEKCCVRAANSMGWVDVVVGGWWWWGGGGVQRMHARTHARTRRLTSPLLPDVNMQLYEHPGPVIKWGPGLHFISLFR